MTAIQHLQHLYALRYTTYIRRNGNGYYLVEGKEIPEAEFKAQHQLPIRVGICIENPDKTKLFLS